MMSRMKLPHSRRTHESARPTWRPISFWPRTLAAAAAVVIVAFMASGARRLCGPVRSRLSAALRAVIKSFQHHWQSWPRPSRQASRPFVYASAALGTKARFCRRSDGLVEVAVVLVVVTNPRPLAGHAVVKRCPRRKQADHKARLFSTFKTTGWLDSRYLTVDLIGSLDTVIQTV
jgi:hypothetical protein